MLNRLLSAATVLMAGQQLPPPRNRLNCQGAVTILSSSMALSSTRRAGSPLLIFSRIRATT